MFTSLSVKRTFLCASFKVAVVALVCPAAQGASSDDLDFEALLNSDFEALMNMSVVTPTRKAEKLFDTPVSTSVLTAQQIRNSGATSLPEALRLVPGMVVRELVNGQYDIHIRGLDGVPPNKGYPDSFNKSTLVMIDNRPVYNHYNGAMLWQELPIDIHDVDRIEVVRGPVGALYGANSATGVIHFITHSASAEKNHVSWSKGEYETEDVRMRFSSKLDDKTALAGSFSHNRRDRTDNLYYSFPDLGYVTADKIIGFSTGQPIDIVQRYPNQSLSLDKTSINLFLDIEGLNNELTRVAVGTSTADFQGVFFTRTTPLGIYKSEHSYASVHHNNQHFTASLNTRHGSLAPVSVNSFDFDYENYQGNVEYRLLDETSMALSLGGAYEHSEYRAEFFPEDADQENPALYLQGHYDLNDQWRVTSAVRGDYFSVQEDTFISWSFGVNYRHSDRLNGRFFMGRSFQSPFYVETYFESSVPINNGVVNFQGNKSMDLVTIDSAELGLRYRLTPEHLLDWEMFVTQSDTYSDISNQTSVVAGQVIVNATFEEIPVEALMLGTTVSIQSHWSEQLTSSFYITAQDTELDDAVEFCGAVSDRDHEGTPTVYGGMVVNYQPTKSVSLNLNTYYLDDQAFDYRDVDEASVPDYIYSDDDTWIVNTKVSYQYNAVTTLYINGRNLVDSRQPQLQYVDHLNSLWMVGVDLDF